MIIKSIKKIGYKEKIYTPQIKDNENYFFENGCLSKNCQNMANSTGQLTMSRIDESCKLVMLGSNRQIDNQYLTKHTNALSTLINSTREFHEEVNLYGVELKKVLRGPITKFAEKVFDNKK